MISTKGVETTAGSKILSGYVPVFDATVAARCRAAGLTLLGKTNTDEFAMGSSTENSALRALAQPWDPSLVPAARAGDLRRGDRGPRAVGARLGHRRLDQAAVCALWERRAPADLRHRLALRRRRFASSLDQVGPVAKTVRDVALLYSIIAGRDLEDSTTVELPGPVVLPEGERLDGLRIGVPRQSDRARGDRARRSQRMRRGARATRGARRRGRECELPRAFDYGIACYYLIAPAEASSNLARYDGVRYGPRSEGATYREMVERTRDEGFGDEPKRRIMLGTYALSAGYYDAYYGQAQKVRTLIIREHRRRLRAVRRDRDADLADGRVPDR